MVRLSKIYTKTGDDGTTGLGDGQRVAKDALRVEAYGTVDEANCSIGLALAVASRLSPAPAEIIAAIEPVLHDLFDVGADLCVPLAPGEQPGTALRITDAQTKRLEDTIDRFNATLPPLTSFLLPAGSELAASLHVARTVVRRAERVCVALATAEPATTSPRVVQYLNRLSDLLFVLARSANRLPGGTGDVVWVPGRNRTPPGP